MSEVFKSVIRSLIGDCNTGMEKVKAKLEEALKEVEEYDGRVNSYENKAT